jgi:DNA replication initiation complex subunit (GINS family)
MDYSALRDIQRSEMQSSAIVKLPEDFYQLISRVLQEKQDEAISIKSLVAIREHENIKKIVRSIAAKREEKIVLMAIRGEIGGEGLTAEEKELLKGLTSIIMKSRETVKSVWESETPAPVGSQKVKLLKNVEKYRGLDNTIYGPFKEGEETLLPKPEAEWLRKSGMAETV